MGEIKEYVAYLLGFWVVLVGAMAGVALLGLPLWVALYSIYWAL